MHAASSALSLLIQDLTVMPQSELRFRGPSRDLGWGQVFGGQLLAQALSAAQQTVAPEQSVHSLHGYFLQPGDVGAPVDYEVERLRDGRSFSTRRVTAFQNERAVYAAMASFQVTEPGLRHQAQMPVVKGPDELATRRQVLRNLKGRIPDGLLENLLSVEQPLDIREFAPRNEPSPEPTTPFNYSWMRAADKLDAPPSVHALLLTYASDFNFLGTSLHPHAVSWINPGMHMTSLDHSLWFHRPARFDQWLLQAVESPAANGARGFSQARFFTADGTLVASAAQEGLIRYRPPSASNSPPDSSLDKDF